MYPSSESTSETLDNSLGIDGLKINSDRCLTLNLLSGGSESTSPRSPEFNEAFLATSPGVDSAVDGRVCQPEERKWFLDAVDEI